MSNPVFFGSIAEYVGVLRSNQTTAEQKNAALRTLSMFANTQPPEDEVDFWQVLTNLLTTTGAHHE